MKSERRVTLSDDHLKQIGSLHLAVSDYSPDNDEMVNSMQWTHFRIDQI